MTKQKELSLEERRQIPLQTSGKYMVDRSVPYQQLSKLQQLAVDQFGGDLERTWDYIFSSTDHKTQEMYVAEATKWEAQAGVQAVNTAISQRLTDKEVDKIVKIEYILAQLNMTEEQVLAASKNPFVPKLWLHIGLLAAACVITGMIVGLTANSTAADILAAVLGCGVTFIGYRVTAAVINCFRFRKIKKLLKH